MSKQSIIPCAICSVDTSLEDITTNELDQDVCLYCSLSDSLPVEPQEEEQELFARDEELNFNQE